MPRSPTPRKPASGLKPALKSAIARAKPAKGPPPSEAAASAQQGLLQLTFARHAHGYGILAAAAFLLNAILLLTLAPQLGSQQPLPLPPGFQIEFLLWLLPAVAGALASWDAVRLKREPYRRHYLSGHFGTSAVGMALFFVVALAIILRQSLPSFVAPWIFPAAVAGLPLTIISIGLT
ncbi:MAG TPA: hypothetical protein VEO18_09050, partial [Thermoplasmata archaeon]|nr:hypothetical protein [Thermoplasmata archaeon]